MKDNMKEVNNKYTGKMSLPKDGIADRFGNSMKRGILLLSIALILLISVNMNAQIAAAQDPYTIYGTIKDENGVGVEGAAIVVENVNTNEKNTAGTDTITGSPIPVTTDSDGKYTFELLNLNSGYSTGDEILVSAEKEGVSDSKSSTVDGEGWGEEVDIALTFGDGEEDEEPFYVSFWWLWIVILLIIIVVILLTRGRATVPKAEQTVGGVEADTEEAAPKKPDEKSAGAGMAFECPECGGELKADDAKCPTCGVEFSET